MLPVFVSLEFSTKKAGVIKNMLTELIYHKGPLFMHHPVNNPLIITKKFCKVIS